MTARASTHRVRAIGRAIAGGWMRFWYAREPAGRLDRFAYALALALFAYGLARATVADEWIGVAGFHPSAAVSPRFAARVPLLPSFAVAPFLVIWLGATAAFMLLPGARRLRRGLLGVMLFGTMWVGAADPVSAFTIDRLFVLALLVLLLAPLPDAAGMRIAWPRRVLQATLLLQYFGAGWCKLVNGDWGLRSDVLWLQVQGVYMTDLAAWAVRTFPPAAFTAMQHAALAFELGAPLLLGVARLRPIGFAIGLGMHLVIALLMQSLWLFSLQIATFYLLFWPPLTRCSADS